MCRGRRLRAEAWAKAQGQDLMDLCEAIGVHERFRRGGKPPEYTDRGLAEWIAGHPLPRGGLLIVGPIGSHKTHLLAARTVDAARRGFTSRLLKWSRFCLEVRASYQAASHETEADVLNRYVGFDYLGIDDLAIGRDEKPETDAAVRLAYALFDARYETCRVTDLTTNCLPDELAGRFDERIGRRIRELTTAYPMLLKEAP